MSSRSSNNPAEKLSDMDSATHSKVMEVDYQFAWTVDNFDQLMKHHRDNTVWGEPKNVSIPLPNGHESAAMTIACIPRKLDPKIFKDYFVEFTVDIKLLPVYMHAADVSVGLWGRTGSGISWRQGGYEKVRVTLQIKSEITKTCYSY
jgi:hypothetical protein